MTDNRTTDKRRCEHCTMELRKSDWLEWMQGEPHTDEGYDPSVKATIEFDKSFGYLLFIENYYEYYDKTLITSIPITHCPWCGNAIDKPESPVNLGAEEAAYYDQQVDVLAKAVLGKEDGDGR